MGFFPSSINILGEMRKTTTNSNFPEKQAIRANFAYPLKVKIEIIISYLKSFPEKRECLNCPGFE